MTDDECDDDGDDYVASVKWGGSEGDSFTRGWQNESGSWLLLVYKIFNFMLLWQVRESKPAVERKNSPVFKLVVVKKTHMTADDDSRR